LLPFEKLTFLSGSFALFLSSLLNRLKAPLAIVIVLSFGIGFLMVLLFGYTSDQKAIKIAKDQLKAHLLAVRLFRDQLPVVLGSYGKILRGTGRYLRLAFTPLLIVIVPLTFLIVQLDRYFGWTPLAPGQSFVMPGACARAGRPGVSPPAPGEMPHGRS